MTKFKKVFIALAILIAAFFIINWAQEQNSRPVDTTSPWAAVGSHPVYAPGEILLKFKTNALERDIVQIRESLNANKVRAFRSKAEHWRLGSGISVEQAITQLNANPLIQYAEPNYALSLNVIPNDARFNEQWALVNTGQTGGTSDADIDVEVAWDTSTGSSDVIVGVIDTGSDYTHPDLAANIWTNPGEIAGNSIDDDGNGYVDDIHGIDTCTYGGHIPDSDPMDDEGHGTHTAGTIGAVGNNGTGVAGVNWQVKIMPLKFIASSGYGYTADAVACLDYSVMMGVDLTSNSWGGGAYSQTLYDAIANANANDMAFVAAAGNSGVNTDTSPHYPSSMDLPNIIAVAATDHNDAKASWSNYGATTVDLAAPGVSVLSTYLPPDMYYFGSGTSMATPHVAGVYALIRSVSPTMPVAQVKTRILNAVDLIPAMAGKCVSNGRLNAQKCVATPDTVLPGMVDDLAAFDPTSNTMGLSWTATGDDGESGTATYYEVRYSTSPIDDTNWASATRAGNEPIPLIAGTPQSMEVRNLMYNTTYYFAMKAFDEWSNVGPLSNIASGTTLPHPTGNVDPTEVSDELFTGEQSDHYVTLSNIGEGTLDFTIPAPALGEPSAVQEPLELGKDEPDPRGGDPVINNHGGPDAFGYQWIDSDEPGGPSFSWQDISTTGMPLGLTSDDQTSTPIDLGFTFPFYGAIFDQIRVCTNGWISFTNTTNNYSNQPLPNSGAPENLIAPFWDDLYPGGVNRTYFQSFGTYAIVQWQEIAHYSGTGTGTYTFQVKLESTGTITFQYLTVTGTLNSATVGIQDATKTVGLQVAFNQAYLHDNLAVRIASIPQWLTASPTSGRLYAGESVPINLHMNASGLEGGTYPALVNILTNDPDHPTLNVSASLHVWGAPDAAVTPASLNFGDVFLGVPANLTLTVLNNGTDTLHVTDIVPSHPELSPNPRVFDIAPHGSREVVVTWTSTVLGLFSGSVTVQSNDAAEPNIVVPCTGNALAAPIMVYDPTSFSATLNSGNQVTVPMTIWNTGGANLIVDAAADQGTGAPASFEPDEGTAGSGGPDAFGYMWKDSDYPSSPPDYNFIDISTTGTTVSFSTSDDALSSAISMGMSFPFYGNSFPSFKVSTNGWLTFDPTETGARGPNYSLPNNTGTQAARNMIAIFWDDLHLRTGNVKYLNDGTRFIIQYTNVGRYTPSTGQSYTFQVQLYPSGRILIMFKSMTTGYLNLATIGIQNGTKTIGLTANYNTNYVHNNMAVQFSDMPDWLNVSPRHAVIVPNGSAAFSVTFDSTKRVGGLYTGAIVLKNNLPDTQNVPALLTVIGAPDVNIIPASYAYGTKFSGYPYSTTFEVVNKGTAALNVSNVYSTDPALTISETGVGGGEQSILGGFTLAPGAAKLFDMTWYPAVPSILNAQIHVLSDDPDTPDKVMPVTGTAIAPPVAVWAPPSFTESLMVGDIAHRTLHLENQGGSDLNFNSWVYLASGATVTVDESPELKKDEEDTRPGLLGSGGPDIYGYTWRDSDQPGGPTYGWIDISATGTTINFASQDDSNFGPIPIGFEFPFYGKKFSTIRACTNGFLSFTDTATSLTNYRLPSTSAPANLLAVFHDDLHQRTGNAKYYSDGSKFIVQYTNWDQYSPSGEFYTFQVILYRSGRILYQYKSMTTNDLAQATIGIQNEAKNDGLTVVYNAAYVHNELAVEFRPPAGWLSVTPEMGTIPAGEAIDLDVMFDATGMIGGDYAANVQLTTNDPAHMQITVPVSMHLTGIPDIDSTPASLSYPMTYVGFSRTLPVTIKNIGTDVLHISDIQISGDFSLLLPQPRPPVALPVGGTYPVTVTFTPTWDGMRYGEISATSDDPDEGTFIIPLEGYALFPPEINVTPSEIHTALPPGGTRTKTVTVCNNGGSDLTWDASPNILSSMGSSTVYEYLELGKDDIDPREGILGSGGPDAFGYTWIDSDEPGGPTPEWFDISGIGTEIVFDPSGYKDDGNVGPFPIGFAFNFYGNTFSNFYACTNGWISFTSTKTTYGNQPLPNNGTAVPENLLALFWDDLVVRSGSGSEVYPSKAYYYNDGTRLIIQYQHLYRIADYDDDINFQVILYPSGKIVYQYGTIIATTMNSHTIGIQNATKDDGLTVVFNDASYIHENMAIEFKRFPEWITLSPMSGTIPAGGCQNVTVTLNAAGLEDGIHEALIKFMSNDPYTPLTTVPVYLNVSLVTPTWVDFDPDVLNLSSNGNYVTMTVELPTDLDPYAIRLSSVMLNDTVPALASPPPEYGDRNANGITDVRFKFDRLAAEATMPVGMEVPVYIQGEVEDVQWWRGMDTIRTMHPRVTSPLAGAYFLTGQVVPIRWDPPVGGTPNHYVVQLTRNGGATWEELAGNVNGTGFDWTASGELTSNALIRVVAMDNQGVMGYDISDGAFTIATEQLQPPYPVGNTLTARIIGTDIQLSWKAPASDPTHGPADHYRILRAENPAGPFNEVASVTTIDYLEPLAATEGMAKVYYRVVAANAAGDEQ